MGRLIQMRVLIQGVGGLGVEIAKNLILAGPKEVVLHDSEVVQTSDLGSNFYLQEKDVGNTTRAKASFNHLQQLNTYVQVSVFHADISQKFLEHFDVVVFTNNYNQDYLQQINQFCRSKNIGFIYTG
jgi:ubiquitin-activating enzyme E1